MFHLTEGETEFCFLVFILTAFSSADGFFVDHLECNRLSGKKYLCTLLQMSQKEIDKVLKGTLARIGMFEIDRVSLMLEDDYLFLYRTLLTEPFQKNSSHVFLEILSPWNVILSHRIYPGSLEKQTHDINPYPALWRSRHG